MRLEDNLIHAYYQETPVVLESTPTTLFTASNKSIKVFDLKNTSSEPEIINTLEQVKGFDLKHNNEQYHGLVVGGFDCAWHDLSDFVIKQNSVRFAPSASANVGQMKKLWKSSTQITQAVFTHGGQRACIGDLAANMVILDVSNSNDSSTFGQVVEKVKVAGEITGLSYSHSVDLLAVTVADGGLSIYSLTSDIPEKKATLGNVLVDKRIALTHEMGLADDDSDLSDFSDNDNFDEDSMFTETTSGIGGKNDRSKNNIMLKFAASKTVWNPVGDVLAVPNKNFKIDFYSVTNWESPMFSLDSGSQHHKNHISGVAYSPNGKLFASISLDKLLIIWDLSTKKILARTSLPFLGCDLTWSDDSTLNIGSNKGSVLTIDGNTFKTLAKETPPDDQQNNRTKPGAVIDESDELGDDVMASNAEEDAADSELDRPMSQDMDGFVIDDENNNNSSLRYNEDSYSRRRNHDTMSESTELTDFNKRSKQRENNNRISSFHIRSGWGKALTKPFSVGSTPWEGSDRRYLSITPIGSVYTVKIQSTYKITVLFFDEEKHRKYFFDDLVGYDLCSINDQGAVFATSGYKKSKGYVARIEYKDHNNGRAGETQWVREIALRPYEFITCLSVHGNYVFVCTNKGFVRKFNLYGRLMDIMMMDCVIGIMNNNNYVFTVIKRSIESGYLFNIQNVDGEFIQQEVGIPLITENDLDDSVTEVPIKSMFFSSDGEPCVVRSDNILFALTKWRDPNSKPIWKPLLDIQEGVLRAGRGRELKAWPLGLFGDSFTFVPFRGSKNFPIFPLLTPMNIDIQIPLNYKDPDIRNKHRDEADEADSETVMSERQDGDEQDTESTENPEEKFLRTIVLAEMLNDAISNNEAGDSDAIEKLQLLSLEYDKTLLIQIDDACSSGDSDDAFELCKMIRDFRALAAAQRLAEIKSMAGLARRIRNLHEARMAEEEEEALEGVQEIVDSPI